MTSWSPERSRKFAALVVGTLAVLAVLWQMGIVTLQGRVQQKRTQIDSVQARLKLAESARDLAPKYEAELEACRRSVEDLESKMAQGDLYRWVINHTLDLADQHRVTLAEWRPQRLAEVDVPPPVPYKAMTYSVYGSAYYHDFGTFLADFENSSPFIRMKGLSLQAAAAGIAEVGEPERLGFQFDFCILVRTNAPAP